MKKLFFIIGLMGLVSLSVIGQKKRELSTPVTVSYALPKIGYDVVVTMECATLIPGPLRQYAEQQLGVKPEITAEGEEWTIKSIRFVPKALLDPKTMYKITSTGEYNAISLSVTPEGFLAGVGSGNMEPLVEEEMIYVENSEPAQASIDYTRFGMRSTLKEVLDSNFTMVEVEGEMRRAWDPIERQALKNEKDYVPEITEEIFNIRKKRLELLAAGAVTEEALKTLNTLEENYVSLFMGKKVKREVVRVLSYVPEKADESTALFRFSTAEGITAKNNVSAQPYLVEIKNITLPKEEVPQSGVRPVPGINYRVAAVADLNLMKGNEKVMSVRCIVPQLGYIKQFPMDVINNEGISVDFYPMYGSLKSILKK